MSPEEPEETQEDVTVPQTPETQDASETGNSRICGRYGACCVGGGSRIGIFGRTVRSRRHSDDPMRAQLAPGYMEGDYYEMTPDAGKQYLVLSIDVTNTGADRWVLMF